MTTFPKFGLSGNRKQPNTYFIELFAICGAQHIAKGSINEAVRQNYSEKLIHAHFLLACLCRGPIEMS